MKIANLSRREFLLGSGLGLAAMAASSQTTTYQGLVETHELAFEDLPLNFEGYRIGIISDVHLGEWLPSDWVSSCLSALLNQKPDLLVLLGDFVLVPDTAVRELFSMFAHSEFGASNRWQLITKVYSRLAELFSGLQVPDGTVAVYGNHDHWISSRKTQDFANSSKVNLLVNRETRIRRGESSLRVYGTDDYWTGWPKSPAFNPDNDEFRIIISHNPDFVSEILGNRGEIFDLALCGHTHGGQIKLPLIGALKLNIQDSRFISGLARVGRSTVYTSRGIGVVGIPIRLNCPPEVSLIVLKRA